MKYESTIKSLSTQYQIYTIDGSNDASGQLRAIQKKAYADNERIIISLPDLNLLNDIQQTINDLDISNFFVMILSDDKELSNKIEQVTRDVSYDPIPMTGVLVKEDSFEIILQQPQSVARRTLEDRIKSLNLPNDTFCILPWIALENGPRGDYGVCCQASERIKDAEGNILSVYNSTAEQALNSHSMRELRRDFLAGRKSKTCSNCWVEEESGRVSKRQNTLDRLKHLGIANQLWTDDHKELMMFDLKVGNICNLKCRICCSYSSSQIATEELKMLPKERRNSSYPYQALKLGEWPRKENHFWKEINEIGNDLRYLEFTGGEPFMIKEHFDFLQTLVDKGVANNIEIHYNTNGTQYPDAEHIWKHFKLVEIAFSIDDVGGRFEYQRKNAKWSEVTSNIKKFKELKKRLGNIHLQVCSTISVFNVMYLEDLANWIDNQGFDWIYWNIVHTEPVNSIRTLPNEAKIKIREILNRADVSERHKKEFENVIQFMENGASSDGTELIKKIKQKDQIRNENLWDHHPELAEAIGYERT